MDNSPVPEHQEEVAVCDCQGGWEHRKSVSLTKRSRLCVPLPLLVLQSNPILSPLEPQGPSPSEPHIRLPSGACTPDLRIFASAVPLLGARAL